MLSFAALYCSAALVDLTHGTTEAHFHFFVMVAMLSIYEEWVPYLLAVGFVVIHHGLVGMIAPGTVYDHGSAALTPWTWALIHAGFIVALCVVNVASWRLNEEARDGMADALEHTRRSEEEFRGAFDDAPIGVAFVDLAGHFRRVNRSLCSLTGFAEADFATLPLHDAPDGTPACSSTGTRAMRSRSRGRSGAPTAPPAGASRAARRSTTPPASRATRSSSCSTCPPASAPSRSSRTRPRTTR